jgi:hypothetical protein
MKLKFKGNKLVSALLLLLLTPVIALFLHHLPTRKTIDNPVVEVRQEGNSYSLYRHGKPYVIKGVGGDQHIEKMAKYGANSIRTWHTDNASQVLDKADSLDLTVTLGLKVGKEWWGQDFDYMDFKAVDQKIAELKQVVEQYKDHRALLMWNVGNEVHLFGGNQLLVLYTINRIAKMIHETDPNHPVMTSIPLGPNFNKRGLMRLLCPDLDALGVNGFARLHLLHDDIRSIFGWNKAYVLTEWAAPGPWEMNNTFWGAPIELSSRHKAQVVDKYWNDIHKDTSLFLGGYSFYWGSKYERTHTFFSLFPEDELETESVQLLRTKWTGENTQNWAPVIDSVVIHTVSSKENRYLVADIKYKATIFAYDPEKDTLTYRWEMREEGKDNFRPGAYYNSMNYLLLENGEETIEFNSPKQEGAYRLFTYVYDGNNHIATYNVPFYVLMQ